MLTNLVKAIWFWFLHRHIEEHGHLAGWDVQSCTAESVVLGANGYPHHHSFQPGDILAHIDANTATSPGDLCVGVGNCHVLFRQITAVNKNGRALTTVPATFSQVFPPETYDASLSDVAIESMLPKCETSTSTSSSSSSIASQLASSMIRPSPKYMVRTERASSDSQDDFERRNRHLQDTGTAIGVKGKEEYCYDFFKQCTKYDKEGYCYFKEWKYHKDGYCWDEDGYKYDKNGKKYDDEDVEKEEAVGQFYLVWEATKDFFLDLWCAFRGLDCDDHDDDEDDDATKGSKDKKDFAESGGTSVTVTYSGGSDSAAYDTESTGSVSNTEGSSGTFGKIFGGLFSVLSFIQSNRGGAARRLTPVPHEQRRELGLFGDLFGNFFGAGTKIAQEAYQNNGGAPGLFNLAGTFVQGQAANTDTTTTTANTESGITRDYQAADNMIAGEQVVTEKKSEEDDDDEDDDKYKDDDDFFKDDDGGYDDDTDDDKAEWWDIFHAIYKYIERLMCIFLGNGFCEESEHPTDDDYPSKDSGGKGGGGKGGKRHLGFLELPELVEKVFHQEAALSSRPLAVPAALEDWLAVNDDGTCRYTDCEPRRRNNGACFEDEHYLYDLNVCTHTIESWFDPSTLGWSFENECSHHGYCYASSSFDKKTCDEHLYSSLLQQACRSNSSIGNTMVLPADTALTMEDLQEHCSMTSLLLYLWMQQTQGVDAYEQLQETQAFYVQHDHKCR